MSESVFQGSLFSSDFLTESITRLADWSSIDAAALKALQTDLRKIYDRFPITKTPNESQTEDDLIGRSLPAWAGPPVFNNRTSPLKAAMTCPTGFSSPMLQRRRRPTASAKNGSAMASA
jgi:hypothetical protein